MNFSIETKGKKNKKIKNKDSNENKETRNH